MNSEQLIENLSNDLGSTKRKPLSQPWKRAAISTLLIFAVVTIQLVLGGDFRPGWFKQLLDFPRLGAEVLVGLLLFANMVWLAIEHSVPDMKNRSWNRYLSAIVLLIVHGSLLAYSFLEPSMTPTMDGKRHMCNAETALYGILPGILIFIQLKRGYVLNREIAGLVAGFGAFFPTAVMMHIACMCDPKHVFINHFMPGYIMALVFLLFSLRALGQMSRD